MSDTKHTAEPWATAYRERGGGSQAQEIFDSDGLTIATLSWYAVRKDEKTVTTNRAENARRIVACVNACTGMADPEKEILALRAAAEKAREALDKVLKVWMCNVEYHDWEPSIKDARSALAALEEGLG